MKFIAKGYESLILETNKGAVTFSRSEYDTKDQALITAIKDTPAFKDGGYSWCNGKRVRQCK